MNSASYVVSIHDAPDAFWGRIIRPFDRLPLPRHVTRAEDIMTQRFFVDQRIELFPGTFAITGTEQRDERHGSKWHWSYKLLEPGPSYDNQGPELAVYADIEYCYPVPLEHVRPDLAEGTGRLAEIIRTIWAVRLGLARMRYQWLPSVE